MRAALILAVAAAGACSAMPAAAASGPVAAARPTVAGTLQQGKKLAANPGTWSGRGAITYAYQWYRCDAAGAHCSSVHGATKATYVQAAKDVAHTLAVTVRATDSTGTTPGYSSLAGLVAATAAKVVPTAQPALSGDPIVGRPLRAEPATWTRTPTATTFGWLRCNANARLCTAIARARADTYTVTAADEGRTLIGTVTATSAGAKQTVLSVSSGVARAAPGPVAAGRPSISGALRQGKPLTGNAGVWSGSGTIAYAYQWYRCDGAGAHCSSILGATRATYTQVAADAGRTIGLTVRATDSTGTTAGYASLAGIVAGAAPAIAVTVQPSLSGIPATGSALRVSGGTFTRAPTTAAYAWLRCNTNGRLCIAIAGATTDTYTVTAADAGHALVAVVTATAGSSHLAAWTTIASIPG